MTHLEVMRRIFSLDMKAVHRLWNWLSRCKSELVDRVEVPVAALAYSKMNTRIFTRVQTSFGSHRSQIRVLVFSNAL